MERTIEKTVSPNQSSKSPPQSQRLMRRMEKKNYASLMVVDDKDSLTSPRSKVSAENQVAKSSKNYNVNIPKTIGNVSSIRGGRVNK